MSSVRALLLGLLLIAPSFAYAGNAAGLSATITPVTQRTPIRARIASGVRKTYKALKHPLIISGIINALGNPAIKHLFGVPYDAKVITTFMVIGTGVGAAYGPALAAWARRNGRQASSGH